MKMTKLEYLPPSLNIISLKQENLKLETVDASLASYVDEQIEAQMRDNLKILENVDGISP